VSQKGSKGTIIGREVEFDEIVGISISGVKAFAMCQQRKHKSVRAIELFDCFRFCASIRKELNYFLLSVLVWNAIIITGSI
jgi:hypothetical protein